MKKFTYLLFTLLLAFSLSGCTGGSDTQATGRPVQDTGEQNDSDQANAEPAKSNSTLTVAMELAYPPFETRDAAGEPTGVSVDLMKAFGEYAGYDIQIQNIVWAGLIPSLQAGAADIVISSMTITDERGHLVEFSDPYANTLLAILSNANSDISSIDDLNHTDKTLAVKSGSTGHMYAEKHLTDTNLLILPNESACVTEVAQGRADGFIYDQLTVYRNWQKNPDTTGAVFIPFQNVEKWGIAVQKGNQALLDQINEFLKAFKENKGYDKLTETYLSDEKKAFDELKFQWFFDMEE